MRLEYFAASNSQNGFVNYFSRVFDSRCCDRVYVIKGGPGTGKSRFMRDVANAAEERGLGVKYYYCSSDPLSLDGIIIEEMRVGILDGTYPHTYEPAFVGAREQIIDLGAFWNEKVLAEQLDEIKRLSREKSEAYKRVYMLLSAYGKLLEAEESIVAPFINRAKISGAVKRWLHRLPDGNFGDECIGICRAVGMNGRVKLDTYEARGGVIFYVNDSFRTAHFLLGEIKNEALKRNMRIEVSYDPVMNGRVDALYLRDAGMTFVIGDGAERKINMKRFIDEEGIKSQREYVKALESQACGAEALVDSCFFNVKKYHFELEKIYAQAMDFGAKEEFAENFIKNLFKKS